MKSTILYIPIILIAVSYLFVNCSGTDEIIKETENKTNTQLSFEERKRMALDYFIQGGIFEAQENYALAVNQYEKALQYDTTAGLYYTLAKNYLSLNRLSNALPYAKNAIKLDSTKLEYFDLLADIYNYGNQKESAIESLESAVKLDSNNVELNFKLARFYEKDRPLKAIRLYDNVLRIIGPDWAVLARIAELQERLGNSDDAINAIKKLVVIDPSNISLRKLLIEFYLKAKRYDDGIILSDEILEMMPTDIEQRQVKAQLLIGKNDWINAAKEFDYILDQPYVDLNDKINIGANYFNKAITDSAILPLAKSFFSKLDEDTTDWQVKFYLGAIAVSEGQDSVAIKNFKYVTENANWNVQAWIRLGGLYFDNRKYEESAKIMQEAIKSFPEDYYVNLILGLSLAQKSKHLDAEPYLKKATIINPKDVIALSAYAFTLGQNKEDEKAIFYLNRALDIEPNDVNLIGTLGLIYNGMREYQKSDSLYEKALELKPDDPLVNNNYAYALAVRGIQLDRALKMVEISIKADSINSSYLDTIGWVHFKLGNFPDAKKYLELAIKYGGDSAVMLDHIGDTEFQLGNKQKAIELWQKAIELDPTKKEIQIKIDTGAI